MTKMDRLTSLVDRSVDCRSTCTHPVTCLRKFAPPPHGGQGSGRSDLGGHRQRTRSSVAGAGNTCDPQPPLPRSPARREGGTLRSRSKGRSGWSGVDSVSGRSLR